MCVSLSPPLDEATLPRPASRDAYDTKRHNHKQVLGLGLGAAEVAEFSALFQTWSAGFLPPAVDLPFTPFGRGLAARREIRARILARIDGGASGALTPLPAGGLVARLLEAFDGDREAVVDNVINVMFAGHDTSSSALTSLVDFLASHPDALARVCAEQARVLQTHGEAVTPDAMAAMPYAAACIRETLRARPIVSGVMRKAGRDVELSPGVVIPKGCPVAVALATIAEREPAWRGDWDEFKPERFLVTAAPGSGGGNNSSGSVSSSSSGVSSSSGEAEAAVALAPSPPTYNPFGIGVRYCLGSHLATAEMTAMVAELAREIARSGRRLEVERPTAWREFPILVPDNGLPGRLAKA